MTEKERIVDVERELFQRLRRWILVLTIVCVLSGGIVGFLMAGRFATAEPPPNFSAAPEALSASFAEVARQVEPAVVNIDTKTNAPDIAVKETPKTEKDSEDDNPVSEFFRRQLPVRPLYSVGSGFIVDKQGYILTNYHVVEDTSRITVSLANGEQFVADVVGIDEETDVAVLKINAGRDLPTVKLGDSNSALVGDWVLAIGSPFGLDQTVTAGIISQVGRETPGTSSFQKFIQTDAAINRGNSGGPLVNMKGEVIGINSQIATSTGDYNGIGFALPSNQAAFVYQQILASGKVKRGYLGVYLDSVKPEFAKVYEMPDLKGAFITEIGDANGAGAKAGLQVNDIIVEFNGQPVTGSQDLITKVASTLPNTNVPFTYMREVGDKLERRTVTVLLGERPPRPGENKTEETSKTPKTEKTSGKMPQLGLNVIDHSAGDGKSSDRSKRRVG
jgi:serine protease Do